MLGSSPSLSSPPGSGLGVTPPPFPPVSSPSPFGEGWEEAFGERRGEATMRNKRKGYQTIYNLEPAVTDRREVIVNVKCGVSRTSCDVELLNEEYYAACTAK